MLSDEGSRDVEGVGVTGEEEEGASLAAARMRRDLGAAIPLGITWIGTQRKDGYRNEYTVETHVRK
jgi:hypothetical protein